MAWGGIGLYERHSLEDHLLRGSLLDPRLSRFCGKKPEVVSLNSYDHVPRCAQRCAIIFLAANRGSKASPGCVSSLKLFEARKLVAGGGIARL